MKETIGVILFILLIVGMFVMVANQISEEKVTACNWITSHDMAVESIEGPNSWNIGPYWYQKNRHIYKVITKNGLVYWFRNPTLFSDWNIYVETTPGQYQQVK